MQKIHCYKCGSDRFHGVKNYVRAKQLRDGEQSTLSLICYDCGHEAQYYVAGASIPIRNIVRTALGR